jgi:putative Mn2+ efflux pump MntP
VSTSTSKKINDCPNQDKKFTISRMKLQPPSHKKVLSFLSLEAFLLSLASSTDNFMVGLSVGLSSSSSSSSISQRTQQQQHHQNLRANLLISLCNATGAGVAAYFGGSVIPQYVPSYLVPLLTSMSFGLLAVKEMTTWCHRTNKNNNNNKNHVKDSQKGQHHFHQQQHHQLEMSRAVQLAIPMTLNNLAGGVAGGAVGVTAWQAALFGLIASFVTMLIGYRIGRYAGKTALNFLPSNNQNSWRKSCSSVFVDPSFVSAILLGVLCVLSCQEALDVALQKS